MPAGGYGSVCRARRGRTGIATGAVSDGSLLTLASSRRMMIRPGRRLVPVRRRATLGRRAWSGVRGSKLGTSGGAPWTPPWTLLILQRPQRFMPPYYLRGSEGPKVQRW